MPGLRSDPQYLGHFSSYLAKEDRAEGGESLQRVEAVEEERGLDDGHRQRVEVQQGPGDYFGDPSQAHHEEELQRNRQGLGIYYKQPIVILSLDDKVGLSVKLFKQ